MPPSDDQHRDSDGHETLAQHSLDKAIDHDDLPSSSSCFCSCCISTLPLTTTFSPAVQPGEDPHLVSDGGAHLHLALHKISLGHLHVDELVCAFLHDCVGRDRQIPPAGAVADEHRREHPGAQQPPGVRDNSADPDRARIRVHFIPNALNIACEDLLWESLHSHLNRITRLDAAQILLIEAGIHIDFVQIDYFDERCAGIGELADRHVPLGNDAFYGRDHRHDHMPVIQAGHALARA